MGSDPHHQLKPQKSATAKRSPSILVTDARANQIKAPFAGHKQERIQRTNSSDRHSPPSWASGSKSKRKPASKFSEISVSNIISNISDIPSSRQRESPRYITSGTEFRSNISGRSSPRTVPQYYKTLPSRTSKIAHKLVLIPDHLQKDGSSVSPSGDYLQEHEESQDETTTDNIFLENHIRTRAEKVSKDQRANEYPRVTAYLISEGFNLNLTSKFLSKHHVVSPRRYDEALYVPYSLPLLPGENGYRVQSNNSAKMAHGNQLMEHFLDKVEQRDHHYEFYSAQEGEGESISRESPQRNSINLVDPEYSSPTNGHNTEFDPSEPQFFVSSSPTESGNTLRKRRTSSNPSIGKKKHSHLPDLTRHAEMFILDYGVVVFWNFTEVHEKNILADLVSGEVQESQEPITFIIKPVPEHAIETEEFHFEYIKDIPTPRIYNDMITLKSGDHLIKLTISHAIAQSTKLSMFESKMSNILNSISRLPKALALTGKLQNYTRKKLLIKTGKLFQLRNEVNLSSNVLDTPEYFWSIEPGLDPLYTAIREYLEIDQRVEVINDRCEVFLDFFDILADSLAERTMTKITMILIIAIGLSVLVSVFEILIRYLIISHASRGS
ncbi:hypothetical protein CANARDRAFT_197964 [[Candida] arabinofermentans NRRL YB-2248]|uniref:DUF155 domain-containing protein n=1 Tax=[Candida] arabinofermentans NRRL YB-2248 TaxID=983967 RepID=A0A1E4T2A2_9ASCO|nr:hypothetical protein CANARDRAFT_197964 [[Candida] arabinofermentans NRRL YB-2248]